MTVKLVRRHHEGLELAGQGCVDGRTVITGFGCLAMPVEAEEFVNPNDLRILFSEIHELKAPNFNIQAPENDQ